MGKSLDRFTQKNSSSLLVFVIGFFILLIVGTFSGLCMFCLRAIVLYRAPILPPPLQKELPIELLSEPQNINRGAPAKRGGTSKPGGKK
jgi:hypothetical protein